MNARHSTALVMVSLLWGCQPMGEVDVSVIDENLMLRVIATSSDFGAVEVGQVSDPITVTLTNDGYKTAQIKHISIDEPFVVAAPELPVQLAPGASMSVDIYFAPVAPGAASGSFYLCACRTDDLALELTGMGIEPAADDIVPPEDGTEPAQRSNEVTGLVLVNADTNADLRVLGVTDAIDLSSHDHGLTIRALVTDDVDVTISDVDGTEVNRQARESLSLNGLDTDGTFAAYDFAPGTHAVTFIPSQKVDGVWQRGTPYSITVTVTGATAPTPVEPPDIDADVVLSGDYGEDQYRPNLSDAHVFDATQASWTIDNCGWNGNQIVGGDNNSYPVLLESSTAGSVWYGGVWDSVIPQTVDWETVYSCNDPAHTGNSAAALFRGGMEAIGLRIDGAWDAVRFDGPSALRDSWISNSRDDGIEADEGESFEVENVLFDNCFVGVSSTPASDMTDESTITLKNVLIKLGNYIYKGNLQPGVFIKGTSNTPRLVIRDTVFAFSKTSSINDNRMTYAWDKLAPADCSNNLLLWLSDEPFPASFPTPPSCFAVKTGDEARSIWQQRRQQFIDAWAY